MNGENLVLALIFTYLIYKLLKIGKSGGIRIVAAWKWYFRHRQLEMAVDTWTVTIKEFKLHLEEMEDKELSRTLYENMSTTNLKAQSEIKRTLDALRVELNQI